MARRSRRSESHPSNPGTPRYSYIDAALMYAYRKTGRIVTEQTAHLLNDEDQLEWNAALDEYARPARAGGDEGVVTSSASTLC